MRRLLGSPARAVIVLASVGLAAGIFVNALALQSGAHPNPIFGAGKGSTIVAQPPATPKPASAPPPVRASAVTDAAVVTGAVKPAATVAAPAHAGAPAATAARRNDVIGDLLRNGSAPTPPPRPGSTQAQPAPGAKAAPQQGAGLQARSQPAAVQPPSRPEASTQVQSAQKALNKLGAVNLTTDGLMGTGTRAAIEKFEKSKGLPVTGELGPKTLKALSAAVGAPVR